MEKIFITITYKIGKRMSLPVDVTTFLLKCQEPTQGEDTHT
jgi:hypothetical protein